MRPPKIRNLILFGTFFFILPLFIFLKQKQSNTYEDENSSQIDMNVSKELLRSLLNNVERITGQKNLITDDTDFDSEQNVKLKLIDSILAMMTHVEKLNRGIAKNKIISSSNNEFQNFVNSTLLELLPSYHRWLSNTTMAPKWHLGGTNSLAKYVFGIPTVFRKKESYLLLTLKNLFDNLTPAEKKISQFIVFIGETNDNLVKSILADIEKYFRNELNDGLLEIISPPDEWYPDMSNLRITLNDPDVRVRWRSKQNLDFAYLWLYARLKPAHYYVQLEDDIVTKPSYVDEISKFVKLQKNSDWIVLDFCSLGFIGKLFRITDLLGFVVQYLIFFNDKPVDWLLSDYFRTKACAIHDSSKVCHANIKKFWIGSKESLFQHIGIYSSLEGKVQKLKDKLFVKEKILMKFHKNPPAKLDSSLKVHLQYTFDNIYLGKGMFWTYPPTDKDYIKIFFNQPQNLQSIRIISGNYLHPGDIFPGKTTLNLRKSNSNEYISLPNAVQSGKLFSLIKPHQNPIVEIYIKFNENVTNWFIINEIEIVKLSS